MRVIIVDDESWRARCCASTWPSIAGIEIVAECANGFEAVKATGELQPDLVFLDIQMPKLDGFEVVELLGERRTRGDLRDGVRRVRAQRLRGARARLPAQALQPRAAGAGAVERRRSACVTAPAPSAHELAGRGAAAGPRSSASWSGTTPACTWCRSSSIDWIEAQDDYVEFAPAARTCKQQTHGRAGEGLDPDAFRARPPLLHRQRRRLARIELYGKDSWLAILSDGAKLPMSRTGHAKLKELIG